ncbi:cytochrome c-type biogenesis protein CcmH, partial [Acinetobacter baumannii]
MAQNPETERRMAEISTELRCLVCQNESIAASRADL